MYDLILLGVFILAIALFLYRKRHNLKRDGLLYLYRTSWGIKLINKIGKKYTRTLQVLSYVAVILGYLLTIGILWLIYNIIEIYLLHPEIVSQIKVPPIMPLIPYIDKVVPFLPPFYFTYWIVILAVVAISHEFSHGIFAAHNKVKIKKTGFGFFPFFAPVFLAAFVELDEKVMAKKQNFKQRAILAAGTFANIVTAMLFVIVLWIFFIGAFHPAGVMFDDYSYNILPVASISMINNVSLSSPTMDEITPLIKNASFNEIKTLQGDYVGIKGFSSDESQVALYDDAPAIRNNINGAILEINGVKVTSIDELGNELSKYSVGEKITVKAKTKNETKIYNIKLGENPVKENSPWLGVGFNKAGGGITSKIFASLSSFKKPNTYYEPIFGEFSWFIYYLLWWLILISVSVALVNMLPVGIFDGGRFFYLTILSITGSEKAASNSFKWATRFFLAILLALMIFWGYGLAF